MTTIYNGTSHKITIYSETDCILNEETRKLILKEGSVPIIELNPGINLNAKITNPSIGKIKGIQLKGIDFVGVDDPYNHFPTATTEDFFIVSNLYVSATKKLDIKGNFLTVGGTVYDNPSNPRPIGCTFLIEN